MGKALLIGGIVLVLAGIGGGYYGYSEYWAFVGGAQEDLDKANAEMEKARETNEKDKKVFAHSAVEAAESHLSVVKKDAFMTWGAALALLIGGAVLVVVGKKKRA